MPSRSSPSYALLAAAALLALGTGPAHAASAGGSSDGGSAFVAKPALRSVKCIRACASRGRAKPGSTLRIRGRALDAATRVVFVGAPGRGDDVAAPVRSGRATRLAVRVPAGAVTGPLYVVASRGVRSRKSRSVPILPPPPPEPSAKLSPVPGTGAGGVPLIETGTSRTKAFYGGRRVVFSYRVGAPVTVRVELVSARDGFVAQSWGPLTPSPGQVQSIKWNGTLPQGAAAPGRYSFRLTAQGPDGMLARSSQVPAQRDAFDLYDHMFPIRARHSYGGGGGRFGAGRGGRTHEGQDVFARCGARLVAARGGRVEHEDFHPAAGNYVVIDGAGITNDYVYAHLAERTPLREGDRVYTGQQIGNVGQTGNARGCHLHFELWSGPGWYDGGRPFDPLPSLRAWDSWS